MFALPGWKTACAGGRKRTPGVKTTKKKNQNLKNKKKEKEGQGNVLSAGRVR